VAIISNSREPATITIPAECLEDVRSALVAEIDNDSDAIRSDHQDVLNGVKFGAEDRAAAMRILRADVHLIDQVLDATAETKLTGDRDAILHALEATIRVLAGRITDQCVYAPIPVGAVLELAERLRWAGEEAVRIEPGIDERKRAA
jgi:hypothetical protein